MSPAFFIGGIMFRPSINGYSISALKTMDGQDGLVIRCNLLKNGKKVGECFDGGYGGEMEFTGQGINGICWSDLDDELNGWGAWHGEDFNWDIGLLVEDLINMGEDYKYYKQSVKAGFNTTATYELPDGNTYLGRAKYEPSIFRSRIERMGAKNIRLYSSESDFTLTV